MRLSIITINLNYGPWLQQTLESVLMQSDHVFEYVVIDGGSTDGSLEIIQKYQERLTYWKSAPDKGVYDAMNKGLSVCTGDIIGIINSGDLLFPNAAQMVVEQFERARCDCVYGDMIVVSPDFHYIKTVTVKNPQKSWNFEVNKVHPAVFVKRVCYEPSGFNSQFKVAGDYDFLLQLFKRGCQFSYIHKPLAYFRSGGLSSRGSKEWIMANRFHLNFFEKILVVMRRSLQFLAGQLGFTLIKSKISRGVQMIKEGGTILRGFLAFPKGLIRFLKYQGHMATGSVDNENFLVLRALCGHVSSSKYPIVEIGTLFGYSTQALAAGKTSEQMLYTVDAYTWNPIGLDPSRHRQLTKANLRYLESVANVRVIEGTSDDFFASNAVSRASLVFIDGSHEYRQVLKDIQNSMKLNPEIIVGDDIAMDEVRQAVVESFGENWSIEGRFWVYRAET